MTIRSYGPTAQSVVPDDDSEVTVVDADGDAVDLTTPVALDGDGKVSFALDDDDAPSSVYVVVERESDGATSRDRWHLGNEHSQGQLRADLNDDLDALDTAIAGWGAPSGTYSVGKDTAVLAALNAVSRLARLSAGGGEPD